MVLLEKEQISEELKSSIELSDDLKSSLALTVSWKKEETYYDELQAVKAAQTETIDKTTQTTDDLIYELLFFLIIKLLSKCLYPMVFLCFYLISVKMCNYFYPIS